MGINLHMPNEEPIGLGMIRVDGSLPAERAKQLTKNCLISLGLSSERDIFGAVTDGVSVMKKFGCLQAFEHQVCVNHGLHLAVTQVIYKRNDHVDDKNEEEDKLEESEECEDDEEEDCASLFEEATDQPLQIEDQFKGTIGKARKIVKLFRRSPVKNDLLQHIQVADGSQGL